MSEPARTLEEILNEAEQFLQSTKEELAGIDAECKHKPGERRRRKHMLAGPLAQRLASLRAELTTATAELERRRLRLQRDCEQVDASLEIDDGDEGGLFEDYCQRRWGMSGQSPVN